MLPGAVAAAVVVGAFGVSAYFGTSNAPPPLPDKPSIAVLPFVNLSGDPLQQALADGLTEDIIIDLARLPDMIVIDRHSVSTYKGKSVTARQVGRELGVRYVLEGSIQEATGKVRISVQLVDAAAGHQLWADRYDREYSDVFALQDEITQKIAWTLAGYATKPMESAAAGHFDGMGTVVEIDTGKSRVVLDHKEVEGLMAAMVMSYQVTPVTLLENIEAGDEVRFTIDPATRMIVEIAPLTE